MPEIRIPRIKGMHRDVPYGQAVQQDGAYAEVLNNLRVDGEEISRRPGTVAGPSPPTLPTVVGAQTEFEVVHLQEINVDPQGSARFALFTERYGWLGKPGSWSQINPRHSDGTISVTNGSDLVTGSGTAWLTRGIKTRDYVEMPNGDFYDIANVNTNTEIRLQSAYTGSTASGQSYEIVRTFEFGAGPASDPSPDVPFLVTQVGDLYIAGNVAGGTVTAVGSQFIDFGVIKVAQGADGSKTSWAASDITYMTAGANEVEIGVDNIGDFVVMRGFGKLSDGRLVVTGHAFSPAFNFSANRRIWYSSNLNPAVWTTSPGGFTDIEDVEGGITASVFYSQTVSVHCENGIVLGELTGQDEPPLRFRPSKARAGAIGPRMVVPCSGGSAIPAREIYVGADLMVYAFSGADSRPVELGGLDKEFVEWRFKGPTDKRSIQSGFGFVDGIRSEVAFCFFYRGGAPTSSFGDCTREVRINYDTGSVWRAQYAGKVNCGYVPRLYRLETSGNPWQVAQQEHRLVIGTSTGSSWYWTLEEGQTSDGFSRTDGNMDGVYMRIGGIDAQAPHRTKVGKHVIVYCRENPYTATAGYALKVVARTDTESGSMVLRENANPLTAAPVKSGMFRGEFPAIFYFPKENKWRNLDLEIGSSDDDDFPLTITRILIDCEFTGDTRADA